MDSIGSHIDRNQTWWHNGGAAWFDYIARGSYLLQMGVADADFLVHLGDVAPLNNLNTNSDHLPPGFCYEYTNTDVLLKRIRIDDGWLVLAEGIRFRALYLSDTEYLHLNTLQKVQALIAKGATVIGDKPQHVIGYSEWNNQRLFDSIVTELWGDGKIGIRHYQQGLVSSFSLHETIEALNYTPDLRLNDRPAKSFKQRRVGDNDLYYFQNDQASYQRIKVDIRDGDGEPEIWHIDDGSVEAIADYTRKGKRLVTQLDVEPFGSRFVMIRRDQHAPEYSTHNSEVIASIYRPKTLDRTVKQLNSPWDVVFKTNDGKTTKTRFESPTNLATHSDENIKHFKGTVVYHTMFLAGEDETDGTQPIYLDLGDVRHIAKITVNGKPLGIRWKPPFAVDVRKVIKKGINELSVKVTNLWINQLLGDETLSIQAQPPTNKQFIYAGDSYFSQSQPLQPSGLLGPVRLIF